MPVKQENTSNGKPPRESFVQKVVNSAIIAKVGETIGKSNKQGGAGDNDGR